MNRRLPLTFALAAVLAFAGCGGDDDDEGADTAPADTVAETAPASGDADVSSKPDVTVPEGEPPAGLQIEDLHEGSGTTARSGDTVTVHYVGVSYATGEEFDSSWDTGQPFTFNLGAGEVIPGWDQGVTGMREGGRRRLVIPPELAYGEQGSPPVIGPNETLVFVVDLVRVGG